MLRVVEVLRAGGRGSADKQISSARHDGVMAHQR